MKTWIIEVRLNSHSPWHHFEKTSSRYLARMMTKVPRAGGYITRIRKLHHDVGTGKPGVSTTAPGAGEGA